MRIICDRSPVCVTHERRTHAKGLLLDIEQLLLMPQNADRWQTFVKTPVTPDITNSGDAHGTLQVVGYPGRQQSP